MQPNFLQLIACLLYACMSVKFDVMQENFQEYISVNLFLVLVTAGSDLFWKDRKENVNQADVIL